MRTILNISGMMSGLLFFSTSAFAIPGILGEAGKSAECGIASTYSSGFRTANGEPYHHMGISAAHKSLPFGTRVIVHNQLSKRSILVRINDRGPFIPGRIIDLSTGAKNALGMGGLAPVCLEVVSYGEGKYVHYHNRHAIRGNHTVYWSNEQIQYHSYVKHHHKHYHKHHHRHHHHKIMRV